MNRPGFDAVALARDAAQHGLVIVAGAGLSMEPPSSLPGWNAINDAFLDGLALLLCEHIDDGGPYQVAELIADRRETAAVAQPDLQAQLAEESLGERYFDLFKPLDIETWNDGHAALAAIAQTGHLRAIVTTNFDRLIECALAAAGVRHQVFCSPDEFDQLALQPGSGGPIQGLPVIKVHGSVGRLETMIDTLSQRVRGRPKSLEDALLGMFGRHAVLLAGFSGADLAYDPKYLGLRAGVGASPSFTVLTRRGSEPRPALAELVAEVPRARMLEGTLPHSLVELALALGHQQTLASPGWDPEHETPGYRKSSLPSNMYFALRDVVSPVKAAVVLARIAEVAGSTDAAQRVLTRSMPHHIEKKLIGDPAMPQHIGMIAANLIEAGHIAADLSEGWFEGDLCALQVLSIPEVRLTTDSLAQAALANALVGDAVQSEIMGIQALRESREDFRPTVRADTVCALARSWSVFERWEQPVVAVLRQAYDLMHDWGDEPRKARLGALLARFLIATGDLDAARAVVVACQAVIGRLNLAVVGNEVIAAAGRLHLAEGRHDLALKALLSACKHHEASQHFLRLAETLLPLAEAAAAAGDADTLKRSRASFGSLLPLMPGLALSDAASRVRLFSRAGAHAEARSVIGDLRKLGKDWGDHVWIAPLADRLTADVERATGAAPDA